MARVVLIVDSSSGALIDVAGNSREYGRYFKFAKRMLSLGANAELDYGFNGSKTLTISSGGSNGEVINLKANVVKISGDLQVDGKSVADIASEQTTTFLSRMKGTPGQINIEEDTDEDTGNKILVFSLDSSISDKIDQLQRTIDDISSSTGKVITKAELADAISGISIGDDDTLEDVKAQLSALLGRLGELVKDDELEEQEQE